MTDIPDVKPLEGRPIEPEAPQATSSGTDPKPNFLSFRRGQEYYTSTGRKVGDFFIGLVGIWLALYIIRMVIFLPLQIMGAMGNLSVMEHLSTLLVAVIIVSLCVYVVGTVLSFRLGRKWIGFGILTNLVLLIIFVIVAVYIIMHAFSGGLF